jgi:inhibitor of KinA sporulation pathway (predicted exonuclease)
MKLGNLVNVIDLEATCWEPRDSKPESEVSEIIEIGISVVNFKDLYIEKSDSILVKPQKSKISKFCTELTTLTQSKVDTGVKFPAAVSLLKENFSSDKRTFVSWGDYDRNMFRDNCKLYNVVYPFGPRHLNLKNLFAILYGLNSEIELKGALEFLDIPLEGTLHRGGDDAKNIAKILIHCLKKFNGK